MKQIYTVYIVMVMTLFPCAKAFPFLVADPGCPPPQSTNQGEPLTISDIRDCFHETDGHPFTLAPIGMITPWLQWNYLEETLTTETGRPNQNDVGTTLTTIRATCTVTLEHVDSSFSVTVVDVNFPPTLENPIPDQSNYSGDSIHFTIPANTFDDIDFDDLAVTTGPLPSWLAYDEETKTFSGTPSRDDWGTFTVDVTAADPEFSVGDSFDWTVTPLNGDPTAPRLIYPQADQAGLGTDVIFEWAPSRDPDNDPITYHLYVSPNADFSSCTPIDVARNESVTGTMLASMILFSVFIFASVSIKKKHSRPGLYIAALCMCAIFMMGCGSSGDDSQLGLLALLRQSTIKYQVTSLSPGTQYYWKVSATDNYGGNVESEVRSFITK